MCGAMVLSASSSFQAAAVDVLVAKTLRAAAARDLEFNAISGGVAASRPNASRSQNLTVRSPAAA